MSISSYFQPDFPERSLSGTDADRADIARTPRLGDMIDNSGQLGAHYHRSRADGSCSLASSLLLSCLLVGLIAYGLQLVNARLNKPESC